ERPAGRVEQRRRRSIKEATTHYCFGQRETRREWCYTCCRRDGKSMRLLRRSTSSRCEEEEDVSPVWCLTREAIYAHAIEGVGVHIMTGSEEDDKSSQSYALLRLQDGMDA